MKTHLVEAITLENRAIKSVVAIAIKLLCFIDML